MHTDVNSGVGALANLFAYYVIIQGGLCGEDDDLLLDVLLLWLRYSFVLLVTSDTYVGCCAWRSFFRPCHDVAMGPRWRSDDLLLRVLAVRLPSLLDNGSLDVTIAHDLISIVNVASSGPAGAWGVLRRRLEEEVIDDHLSLVHVHRRCHI